MTQIIKPSVRLSTENIEIYIHQLVNAERRRFDLRQLDYDPRLATIARGHSADMARRSYFNHNSPEGRGADDRARAAGYPSRRQVGNRIYGIGENIFMTNSYNARRREWETVRWPDGRETRRNEREITNWYTNPEIAELVVSGWMNSPGHRENLLRSHFDREGIGIATANEIIYITQNLF